MNCLNLNILTGLSSTCEGRCTSLISLGGQCKLRKQVFACGFNSVYRAQISVWSTHERHSLHDAPQ